jgi:hypothetical protein
MARDLRRHGTRHADEPIRITTAGTSRGEEIAGRQRRYVLSMGIRTVCFVAAIVVGPGWVRWVLVAAAVLLPYVAVVMANATSTKDDGFALRPGGPQVRALDPGEPGDTPPDGAAHP